MDLSSYDFPQEWRIVPIRDAYRFTKKPRGAGSLKPATTPFLPMEAIPHGRMFVSEYEARAEAQLTSGTYVENGDLLIAKITPSFENGKQAILNWDRPAGYATTEVIPLQEIEGLSDKRYLFHLLLHPELRGELAGKMDGTTGRQRLSKETLGNRVIPLPPLFEQQAIANILGIIRQALDQQNELIALTAALKNTMLKQLFRRGLNAEKQRQTEIGLIPARWQVVKLSDVCTFQSGGTPSKQRPEFWRGSIPWVSPKDMKRARLSDVSDHISQEGLEAGSKLAPAGSVFIVVRGMILAKDIPVALAEIPMAINQDMKAIIPGPGVGSDYLLYAITAFKDILFQKVGRSAHGTMTLMSSEIANFQIPLPDRVTQESIASAIKIVDCKQDLHKCKHTILTECFRTMLHQLMTGRVRASAAGIPGVLGHRCNVDSPL